MAKELKDSIIELYQNVKIRKQSNTNIFDRDYLEKEKISLSSISPIILIDYIKIHLNLLIDIKVNDKISKLKENPLEHISSNGSEIPANDYEKLLRRYEGDIRNYIRIVNMLKIHIGELNERQEILEKQIEQLQKETVNLIPTTQSIEYKKKIEELTALIKTYEKNNLQIPLLEKKIKIQKIELDKLDNYYKKQIKNYTKKIENYEKGIYLNNLNNNKINKTKKTKIFNSNYNNSIYTKKTKNRIYSNSPRRENKRFTNEEITENDKNINIIKKTKSINAIYFKIKNNEIRKKIEDDINSNINLNLNITHKVNGGNLYQSPSDEIIEKNKNSPKFGKNNNIESFYDSIETDANENKTINISNTMTNFRKKINLKTNCNSSKLLITNREKIRKIQANSNSKKIIKKINSNRASLKIPKRLPEHIKTSKYIHLKEKHIPNFSRYNSLKQLTNGKNKIITNITKENETFNKTFSRVQCTNNVNLSTGPNNIIKNTNKYQRNAVKNFILNKINNNTIVNGRTPLPLQKTLSKTSCFIIK